VPTTKGQSGKPTPTATTGKWSVTPVPAS
jgi:hypothetical protein